MITETTTIQVNQTSNSKLSQVDFDNLKFGRVFSDHMFISDYEDGKWQNPRIMPFGNIEVSPASCVIHYGQSIFEGMKAHKGDNGDILLFRPLENHKRLNRSARRMSMPEVSEELFMTSMKELIKLDQGWVPDNAGSSLYIRPYMFATEEFLGVNPSDEYKFMIITSPASTYYKGAVKVKVETDFSRACPGGVGSAKAAGNYAASLFPAQKARKEGFHQLVWTDASEHKYIEESGTMNIMFLFDDTLVTPPISNETILPGITRDSVLTLAKDRGIKVEERRVSIDEVVKAHQKGILKDMFGTGTAATIAPIESFTYENETYELPALESRSVSNGLASTLKGIKRGDVEDPYGWIEKVEL